MMLSPDDREVLSEVFDILPQEVLFDETVIEEDAFHPDDLHAGLKRRHGWQAGTTYRYLSSIIQMQQYDRTGSP